MQIIEFMYYKLIHRPEEAMDIQTEWRFVNGLVHLPQDCNLHAVSFHLATPPSPLLWLERQFPGLHDVTVKDLSMRLLILQYLFSVGGVWLI